MEDAWPDSPDWMPDALVSGLKELEEWALGNRREARREGLAFWVLKIPAIVVSASAGISAYFGLSGAAVIAGALGSLCVLIDGLCPMGRLRNIHTRAFFDIRVLEQDIRDRWTAASVKRATPWRETAAALIEKARVEKARISQYLKAAEASLDPKQK